MENMGGGLLWVLITIAGVAALGIAMVYGTMNWRTRRQHNAHGPASVPGPTPKAQEGLPDSRATVDDRPGA
jgi:hypothetical protein